jgi:hypothetical protein
MNLRALYPIFQAPVRFEKVADGLWVMGGAKLTEGTTEEEYLRSVDLFTRPLNSVRETLKIITSESIS